LNKIKIEQNIVINRPSGEIFAYLSALENLADWSGATIAVKNISQEVMHVGATAQSTIRFLGRRFDITLEVVECEPYRSLTIKSISGVAPCLFCYQFEAIEDNRTNVSQEVVIHLTEGVLEHTTPVIEGATRRQLEYDLLTLKDILEGKASSYRSAD